MIQQDPYRPVSPIRAITPRSRGWTGEARGVGEGTGFPTGVGVGTSVSTRTGSDSCNMEDTFGSGLTLFVEFSI